MLAFLKRLKGSDLVRGSIFIFIANNTVNFGNFLYNLMMGRLLGPEKYGELGALLSILVITGVPLSILSLLIIKLVSSYWGKGELGKIYSLYLVLTPRLFLSGFLASIIMVLFIPQIAGFLYINSYLPLIIITFYLTISFPATLNKSIFSGSLYFSFLTLNSFVEVLTKLLLSFTFVLNNLDVSGALLGAFLATVIRYLLATFELRMIIGKVKNISMHIEKEMLLKTFFPVFMVSFALTSFFTVDIIMVRHFFPATEAGDYVAVSTIAKIIYYAVGPIIGVMFPIISSRVSGGKSYILPLLGTLVMTLFISSGAMFIYFLIPQVIIGFLYGDKYISASVYLGLFSFFITIYTINSILTHFLLSISYYKPLFLLFIISLLQGVFIFIFHNNINEVIWVNITVSIVYLTVVSLFVVRKEYKVVRKISEKLNNLIIPA